MRTTAPAREAFAAAIALIAAGGTVDLRLRSGDEGRQAIDAASVHRRLRLRLILRLRTMLALATMLARLLVTLIGLLVVALMIASAALAHIRLLLLRLVLAELFLRGGDQAEIMLGVLIVVFGGDGVAGRPRIARELQIFLGDV